MSTSRRNQAGHFVTHREGQVRAGPTMTGDRRRVWRAGVLLLCTGSMALATASIPALPPSRIQLSTEFVQAQRQAFERLGTLQFEQVAPAIVGDLPLAFTLTVTVPRQPGQGVLLQAAVRNRSDQPVRWKVVPPGLPDFGILDAQGDLGVDLPRVPDVPRRPVADAGRPGRAPEFLLVARPEPGRSTCAARPLSSTHRTPVTRTGSRVTSGASACRTRAGALPVLRSLFPRCCAAERTADKAEPKAASTLRG